MRLKITHRTEYRYDAPLSYALQRLRLCPQSGPTQDVVEWSLKTEGATEEAQFIDGFGNDTRLVSIDGEPHTIVLQASGIVETRDTAGVTGKHQGLAPLWLFEQQTPLCTAGRGISALVRDITGAADVERLHALMNEVRERVA